MCPGVQGCYYLFPFKSSKVFDRLIEGFIKAGFKTDSTNYYKLHKDNKMTGLEIRQLVFGKKMVIFSHGKKFPVKINKDGESEIKYFSTVFKGKYWIEGDLLCSRYKKLYSGLKNCANIFRNPQGDKKTFSEYLLLSNYWLNMFSVEE